MVVCVCNPCRAKHTVLVDGVEQPGQDVSPSTRTRHEKAQEEARKRGGPAATATDSAIPRTIPVNAEDVIAQGV